MYYTLRRCTSLLCKTMYSETSLNRTLKKSALPEYRPIFFKSLLNNTSYPLNQPICLVPVLAGLEKFHCNQNGKSAVN
jgi:hypothetical protein